MMYKCTIGKNGKKYYFKKTKGKWKRVSNSCGINALKNDHSINSKKKYNYRERTDKTPRVKKIPLTRYSLWGIPDKSSKAYVKLQREIDYLADLYNLPKFKPHITIAAGIQLDPIINVRDNMKELKKKIKKYKVSMKEVKQGSRWNQSIFILGHRGKHVKNAHKVAEEIFRIKHPAGYKGKYTPHTSLAYSNLSLEKRREIVDYINGKFPNLNSLDFTVNKIELWNTSGGLQGVPTWKKVKGIRLK